MVATCTSARESGGFPGQGCLGGYALHEVAEATRFPCRGLMALGSAAGSILGATHTDRLASVLHVALPKKHHRSVDAEGNLRVNRTVSRGQHDASPPASSTAPAQARALEVCCLGAVVSLLQGLPAHVAPCMGRPSMTPKQLERPARTHPRCWPRSRACQKSWSQHRWGPAAARGCELRGGFSGTLGRRVGPCL